MQHLSISLRCCPTSYLELSIEERASIQVGQAQGMSLRHIAQLLGRAPSTISREIRRNQMAQNGYCARHAQRQREKRRVVYRPARKLLLGTERFDLIVHMLRRRLSPKQISGKLKTMKLPDLRDAYVCRKTIYTAIYALPVGHLRKELIHCLRQGKTTRKPHRGEVDRRGQIPDMVSIHLRPPEVSKREMPGHWEGDLIKGKNNASAVGTLVELSSSYLILAKMDDATANVAGFSAALNRMPTTARKSMTYDQGREMAQHAKITQETGVAIYFCDPHSPWQRGASENINGLIRQTDLSVHSQEELDAIAFELNMRPRKRFGFKCPIEVMSKLMAKYHESPSTIQ